MKRINRGYILGSLLTLLSFIILNVRSYSLESAEFAARRAASTLRFSHDGFYWGFPLKWFFVGTCYPCDGLGWFLLGLYLNSSIVFWAAFVTVSYLNKAIQRRFGLR